MANSPGPSTSNHSTQLVNGNSDSSEKNPKKQRTRRKPRNRAKKDIPEPTKGSKPIKQNQPTPSSIRTKFPLNPVTFPQLVINAVKEAKGASYKQREDRTSHIKLQPFLSKQFPSVFVSKNSGADSNHLSERFQKLALRNGVSPSDASTPSSSKQTKQQKKDRARAKRKEKEEENFEEFLTPEEVTAGLETGELIKGFIRINPKNCKDSYVGNEDANKIDYYITSFVDRNRALDGDQVVLKQKGVEDDKVLMKVVYIIKQVHPRTAVGYLELPNNKKDYANFYPRDQRIPRLRIPKISWPTGFQTNAKLYSDILFVAKITDWTKVGYAQGTIIENLGVNGDLKVESLAILREFCLDATPYTNEINRFLPKTAEIPPREFEYREDIRQECVFTIDPLTAKDLDDAVSCKELANGNFEVGVHISDASFFLEPNTDLDYKVREKATTIYMVDRAYHMLPTELCMHCSLLPGLDKLAFSVFWEMTSSGEVVSKRITRTVINSCAQLAYEHAQMMIEDPENVDEDCMPEICNNFTAKDLSKIVNDLQRIAVNLRQKRRENGALKIDQIKINFELNPQTGEPFKFFTYENKDAHRLIEEFMLLANVTVAEHIHEVYPDLAFLRLHEPPKPTMMIELQKVLETVGIHIDIETSRGLQKSLDKYQSDDFLGASRAVVLNHLLAKPMKRARYFCAGALDEMASIRHFALSIPIYTHFTSPIRRYADIVTHRLLAASLNYTEKPEISTEELAEIAETCNRQKYHAKRAGEASCDLYLAHFIERNQPCVEDCVVVETRERSIDVIVLKTGSVVRIHTKSFEKKVAWKAEEIQVQKDPDDDTFVKRLWKMTLTFPKTITEPELVVVLEMFSLVRVALSRKEKSNKIEAQLLRPKPNLIL